MIVPVGWRGALSAAVARRLPWRRRPCSRRRSRAPARTPVAPRDPRRNRPSSIRNRRSRRCPISASPGPISRAAPPVAPDPTPRPTVAGGDALRAIAIDGIDAVCDARCCASASRSCRRSNANDGSPPTPRSSIAARARMRTLLTTLLRGRGLLRRARRRRGSSRGGAAARRARGRRRARSIRSTACTLAGLERRATRRRCCATRSA